MLKLSEVRKMTKVANEGKKVPTAKNLVESSVPVIAQEDWGNGSALMVYENGYVLYRRGKWATVFPLDSCQGYTYRSDVMEGTEVSAEYFDDMAWYLRLLLEGEDRLVHNEENRIGRKNISYSAVAEDWGLLGREDQELENLILAESAGEVMGRISSIITKRQKYILCRYYLDGLKQTEIAKELGVVPQTVSDQLQKAKRRIARNRREIWPE